MTATLLALGSAAFLGVADFLGGLASRRVSPLSVALLSRLAGLIILLPLLGLQAARFQEGALWWGAVAGIAGGIGVMMLYRALARGMMAIVAPITAVTATGLPVIVSLALGDRPSLVQIIGVLAGISALVLLGWVKRVPDQLDWTSVAMALVAGAGFGLGFIGTAQAPANSGFWPLILIQCFSIATIAAVLVGIRRGQWRIERRQLLVPCASGVLVALASVLYLVAVRQGALALIVVLASMYPIMTVTLSVAMLRERLSGHQFAGLGLALVSIGLIAAG